LAAYGSGGDDNGPNYPDANGDDVHAPGVCGPSPGVCAGSATGPSGAENMPCYLTSNGYDQATTRSRHPGGVFLAMVDGHVEWVGDDVETNGCYNTTCCSAWDYMILSADEGQGGGMQGIRRGGCTSTP
jgi:prepilin-type processing-associated H-X9-DG protein